MKMPEWDYLPSDERSILKARQGVQHLCIEEVDVRDSTTMKKARGWCNSGRSHA